MTEKKQEEKKEKWLGYVAMTTILFAVCATLSTFKGGQHSTKAVLSQSKASNQWAYYQAKDLKSYLHELQKEELELDLLKGERGSQAYVDAVRKDIAAYGEKIRKYDTQKEEIKKQAEEFEQIISQSRNHSQAFGMAMIFLQIAILLSSISALMKIKHLWFGGMVLGSVGLVFFANGFFLFF